MRSKSLAILCAFKLALVSVNSETDIPNNVSVGQVCSVEERDGHQKAADTNQSSVDLMDDFAHFLVAWHLNVGKLLFHSEGFIF